MSGLGPEWREVSYVEYRDDRVPPGRTATVRVGDEDPHYFIRDAPLPELPIEPYTVIRATWDDAKVVMVLVDGRWLWVNPNAESDAEQLSAARVEVLAEPRAVTAKAVLDRMREQSGRFIPKGNIIAAADAVADEFGVTE